MKGLRRTAAIACLCLTLLAGSTAMASDSAEIILADGAISADVPGVSVNGSTVTIAQAGSYRLSGTLSDGQVVVDAPSGDVTLLLDGVHIGCASDAALLILDAKLVTLTLAESRENSLDGPSGYAPDSEADAVLFSKSDLVINGSGALTVTAPAGDGIASRDTLTIEGGRLNITAADHGIKGKDYLLILDGGITVSAGGDGMKSTNDTQDALGYVEIRGGSFAISADDDGISAVTRITLLGGTCAIQTGNNGMKSDSLIDIQAGDITIDTRDDDFVCETLTGSGNATITINGEAISLGG
ncbi:carbohydrate-binding domain-containing protein [Eubacteriales bacterium OttesenSCG-928-A19]|nr:carbohydrate-binding domain-containing protein [Eubacteriales bacterium OttesenSCG-928-A19]